jgi:hypothetical protein
VSGWIIPRLTDEVEFRLAAAAVEINAAMEEDPQTVAQAALMLARQNAIQEAIIRQATMRIAELEQRAARGLGPDDGAERWLEIARGMPPWWVVWFKRLVNLARR